MVESGEITPDRDLKNSDRLMNPASEIPRSGGGPPVPPGEEVTARVLADKTLRMMEGQFQALMRAIPLAIVTIGRDERVQMWNLAAERLFGWKAEDVIGSPFPIVLKENRADFRARLEADLQGKQQDGLEVRCLRKDGSLVEVSLWTVPLRDDDGEIVGSIALFADISQRKREQEALATRTRHLEAVRAVSEEITRELNLSGLLRLIIRRAVELVDANSGVVYQWNESDQVLVAGAWYGYEDWAGKIRRKLGDGVAGRIAQCRQGLLVNDYQHWPGANPLFRDRSKLTAVLGEPLLYHDQLLGVITLDDQKTERLFTEQDQETLRLFATQAAIAIGNARLFQQEQERSEELDTVRAVSAEIARELDLSKLLRMINRRSMELLGASSGAVLLWDEATQMLVPTAWHGHGDWYRDVRYNLKEGIVGMVAGLRQGMVVNDYRNSPYAHPLFLLRTEIAATLAEPLLYRDRLLGVVAVDARGEGRIFNDKDKSLLSVFASQAAIAIENAQLYARSEARASELQTLGEIGQIIAGELNLSAVLEAVVAGAMRLLDNPFAQIILWDEVSQSLRFGAAWGPEAERVKNQKFELGRGINGVVAQTREAMILDDYQSSPYAVPECLDVVATISVPILFGDRLLGVLHSHTTTAGRRFTPDDLRRLQMLATQAAYAIENARLHEEAVRRSSERGALLLSSKAIGSSLDLNQVLQAIVQQAAAISATPIVRVFLLDEDTQLLRCRVAVGFPLKDEADLVIPVGASLSGQVAVTHEPLAVPDTREDPRTHFPGHVAKYGVVSYLGLPVKLQDRLFGVLVFNTPAPRAYSQDEITFLTAFAQQAALAIQNARLYETAVRQGEEREALLRATRSVMAGLDLGEILERIVAEASNIANSLHVKVLLLERATQFLRVVAAKGTATPVGHEIELGASLSGIVAQTGESLYQADSSTDSRNPSSQADRDLGIVTYLGLPIKKGGEVLGVLTINTTVPRQYSAKELAYLSAFADQASVAIENARLHEEVQRHAAELEARVKERTGELQEALRAKAEFLGKMSHELRTPLNFVLGFSDLLRQAIGGPLTSKQAMYVERIQAGGRRLLNLVNDVLDIAQVDAGKSRLQLEPVILGPLIQEVLGSVQVQVTQKRLMVTTALDPWMPFIVADRFKLGQILQILLGNAVKFTPEKGTITLRARRVSDDCRLPIADCRLKEPGDPNPKLQIENRQSGDWLEITVTDTGIGIRPEDLETIFGAFYQVDSSATRAYGGAGLGLTLVRKLVDLHGGRVWAESAGPGQGSRFVVRLPVLEVPRPKRILAVEDERAVLDAVAVALTAAGYAVERAESGAQALASLVERPPDLLLLDIGLSDMNGREILRRLREDEGSRATPVLVLTGPECGSANQAMALGADEFLGKPVSARVLVEVVDRLLSQPAAVRTVVEDQPRLHNTE